MVWLGCIPHFAKWRQLPSAEDTKEFVYISADIVPYIDEFSFAAPRGIVNHYFDVSFLSHGTEPS